MALEKWVSRAPSDLPFIIYLTVSGTQLDGREAGLDLIIGVLELGVVEERRSDAT